MADEIGKLPDKSVTEVPQRITGVTIDRTMNRGSPQRGIGMMAGYVNKRLPLATISSYAAAHVRPFRVPVSGAEA